MQGFGDSLFMVPDNQFKHPNAWWNWVRLNPVRRKYNIALSLNFGENWFCYDNICLHYKTLNEIILLET